ncbi:16820_t:CDS:2, partial [Gigaspora rosea]
HHVFTEIKAEIKTYQLIKRRDEITNGEDSTLPKLASHENVLETSSRKAKFYYTDKENEATNDGEVDSDGSWKKLLQQLTNPADLIDEARKPPGLIEISTANVNQNSNYHSFIESHTNIDELSYISVKVFSQLRYGLFSLISDSGYAIFAHIPPSSFIYYLGEGNFASFDEKLGLLIVNNATSELFNYFNTSNIKQRLQEIL